MSTKLGNVSLTLNDTVENWVMDLLSDVDTSLSTLRLYNGTTTSLMTVLRNGKVGFGIDNPNSTVHVATSMAVTRIGSAPHIVLCGAGGGTLSSPTATLAGGGIGKISGNTYDGTNWVTSADITMYASENATSGSRGGYITFNTIPTGSATLAERMRIDVNGNMGLGVAPSAWGSYKAFDVGAAGNGLYGISSEIGLTSNAYFNSGWKYGASSIVPTRYASGGGYHQWYAAASGTAGGSFTWSPLMSLDSNGYLTLNGYARMLIQPSATVNNALLQFNNGAGNGYVGLDSASGSLDVPYALTLWHTGAYPIVMGTNNAERMRIDATGNVSIGTTGTTDRFTVQSPLTGTTTGSNTVARFQTSGSGYDAHIALGDAVNAAARLGYLSGALYAWTNGAERMRIDTSGNVGIGGAPTQKLDVIGATDTAAQVRTTGTTNSAFISLSSGNGTTSGQYAYVRFLNNDSTGQQWRMGTYGSNNFTIRDHLVGTTRFVIDTAGNVGVNTAAPSGLLHMRGTTGTTLIVDSSATTTGAANTGSQIEFWGSDGVTSYTWARIGGGKENGTSGNQASYFSIQTRANGGSLTERFRIDSSGNVGIGLTDPTTVLTGFSGGSTGVAIASAGVPTLALYDSENSTYKSYVANSSGDMYVSNSATGKSLIFSNAGSERMRIDSSGNVGIGTTTPAARLDIGSDSLTVPNTQTAILSRGADINFRLVARNGGSTNNAGDTTFQFGQAYSTGAVAAGLSFVRGGSSSSGYLKFVTNSTDQMVLDSNGNVGVGVTPSAWNGNYRVIELQNGSISNSTSNAIRLNNNVIFGSTTTTYKVTDFATSYLQYQGQHQWYTAPSGAAGNPITFTQTMTLDAAGDVMIGQTSSIYAMPNRRVLNVNGASTALISVSSGMMGATSGYLYWDGGNLSLSNNSTTGSLLFGTNGGASRMEITAAGVIRDSAGNELGYKDIPPATNSFERGKANVITASTTVNTGSLAGDTYHVYNNSAASVTLTQGSGLTMRQGGTTNTGSRTLLPRGFATIWFISTTECVVNGNIT